VIDIRDSAPWTRSTELFEGLTDSVCEAILSTCYRGGFSPNETIYREGEPKEAIFLLAEGRVKVSQVSKKGKEVLLWLNLPGRSSVRLIWLRMVSTLPPRGLFSRARS